MSHFTGHQVLLPKKVPAPPDLTGPVGTVFNYQILKDISSGFSCKVQVNLIRKKNLSSDTGG
jgi:hypothetical protein